MDIELRGITKRFGDLVANDSINLHIRAGEVLGLLGENGAGKTTLMNVLYGLYQPDLGEVCFEGQAVKVKTPAEALLRGVGMVHQHFTLVPTLTVTENVVLGHEPTTWGRLDGAGTVAGAGPLAGRPRLLRAVRRTRSGAPAQHARLCAAAWCGAAFSRGGGAAAARGRTRAGRTAGAV